MFLLPALCKFTVQNNNKMKQALINLYQFSELSEESKKIAIETHKDFLDNHPQDFEEEDGKIELIYVEHTEEEVIESIEINDYYFFKDGEMADVVKYTGQHPKSGIVELVFHGQIIEI